MRSEIQNDQMTFFYRFHSYEFIAYMIKSLHNKGNNNKYRSDKSLVIHNIFTLDKITFHQVDCESVIKKKTGGFKSILYFLETSDVK